jgi:hypothetical protein
LCNVLAPRFEPQGTLTTVVVEVFTQHRPSPVSVPILAEIFLHTLLSADCPFHPIS